MHEVVVPAHHFPDHSASKRDCCSAFLPFVEMENESVPSSRVSDISVLIYFGASLGIEEKKFSAILGTETLALFPAMSGLCISSPFFLDKDRIATFLPCCKLTLP